MLRRWVRKLKVDAVTEFAFLKSSIASEWSFNILLDILRLILVAVKNNSFCTVVKLFIEHWSATKKSILVNLHWTVWAEGFVKRGNVIENVATPKIQKFCFVGTISLRLCPPSLPSPMPTKAIYQPARLLGIFLQCLYKASHADSGKDEVIPLWTCSKRI